MIETESGFDYKTYEKTDNDIKHIYTMVNLGNDEYHLLFEEVYNKEKLLYSIDALVDENGNYTRIILDTSSFEKSIHINGNEVISDNIFVKRKDSLYGKVYCSSLVKNKVSLEDYLEMNPTYSSIEDEEYKPSIDSNIIISSFIKASKELKSKLKLLRVPSNN